MSSNIPPSHPRYESLMMREKIAKSFHKGLVHETGLIAHGRGEAFDYLIGEKTIPIADQAAKTAAAVLLLAKHPVISVNGNVVALVAKEIVSLAEKIPSLIEVNLFHRTKERVFHLISQMESSGGKNVLGAHAQARINGLSHNRGWCEKEGIFSADVVLVPLEDGDRCQALRQMGKTVITIDLNPLSRTAKTADVTIVDNIVRSIPRICFWVDELKNYSLADLKKIQDYWENKKALDNVLAFICSKVQKD
ncbi:MAG: 4-phosphopantoate--beta-alanine ligase [Candidatus Thermoplasmatota archaeon]|nr:4-phosphopantoate--beta-alanine ligase [Candidatus Thermoplasmatota archaeon]